MNQIEQIFKMSCDQHHLKNARPLSTTTMISFLELDLRQSFISPALTHQKSHVKFKAFPLDSAISFLSTQIPPVEV